MGTFEIFRTIVEEFPYALFGSMIVGAMCAFLGVYIVARRVVFLGAVLTQVSIFGLVLTFIPLMSAVSHSHTIWSLILTLIAVVVLSRMLTGARFPRDAVLGIVFVGSIAGRILIMQKTPRMEVAEVESLLRGDILFTTPELFYVTLAVIVGVLAVHLLLFKEFTYISFDAETARTQGYRAGFWEMLFYVLAAVVISVATHMVGDVFVFGFLVIPPVAAMLLTRRVRRIFLVSALIGLLSPVLGLFLAFRFDFPSSPAVVAVALAVLVLAWTTTLLKRSP